MDKIYSKDLALYFDTLRFERGISQEDFVFDIVSIRQYRRYLKGDCKIPQTAINQFSKKLGFKPEHVILDFESARIEETKKITAYYNAVINNDAQKIVELEQSLHLNTIFDRNNRMLYQFALYIKQFRAKRMHEADLVARVKEMIGYPEILHMNRLSSAEVILMSNLLSYKSFSDQNLVAQKLKSFIQDTSHIISGYNERIKFLCLQRLSDYHGMKKEYSEVIKLCNYALEGLVQLKSYYLMDFFYYHQALAYYFLDDMSTHKDRLYRCYCILQAENIKPKIDKFIKRIESDFKVYFHQFIIQYTPEFIEKNR